MDCDTRFCVAERYTRTHNVAFPDPVLGWFLLRRAGLDKEGNQLVMLQIGDIITPHRVEGQLKTTFGLDSMPSSRG
eukprot:8697968-Pyramimonas_sp.AAC.1